MAVGAFGDRPPLAPQTNTGRVLIDHSTIAVMFCTAGNHGAAVFRGEPLD